MKIFKNIFFIIVFNLSVFAQLFTEWIVIINGNADESDLSGKIVNDSSGNIIITGSIKETISQSNIIVIKYNSRGSEIWRSVFDYNNQEDYYKSILKDNNDNLYVIGYTYGNNTNVDIIVLKYSSDGNLLWSYRYDSEQSDTDDYANAVLDSAGNIYLAGYTQTGYYDERFLLIKLDNNGNLLWTQRPNQELYGGFAGINVNKNSSDISVTGYTRETTYGYFDMITQKFSSNGKLRWSKRFGNTYTDEYGEQIITDQSENIIVCGKYPSGGYAIKYDTFGNQQWLTIYGYSPYDFTNEIITDKFDNIYIGGATLLSFTNFSTIKLSSDGTILWRKYRGCGSNESIVLDSALNIYSTGMICNDAINNHDIGIVKYNSTGDQQWFVMYNSYASEDDEGSDIYVDNTGHVYVLGKITNINESQDIIFMKYSQLNSTGKISQNTPDRFELYQNYPNPFNPKTTLRFAIPSKVNPLTADEKSNVRLVIYDLLGREVGTLVNDEMNTGVYKVEFDGSSFASGVYFYSLIVGENIIDTKKMLLLK